MEKRNVDECGILMRKFMPTKLGINLNFTNVADTSLFKECDRQHMKNIPYITRKFVELYLYGSSEDIQQFWDKNLPETIGNSKITPQDVGFMIAAFRRIEQPIPEISFEDLADLKREVKKLKKQLKKKKRKIKKLESRLYCKKDKQTLEDTKEELKTIINNIYGKRIEYPTTSTIGICDISLLFRQLANFLRDTLKDTGVSPFAIRDPHINGKAIIFDNKSSDICFCTRDIESIGIAMINYIKGSPFIKEPRVCLLSHDSWICNRSLIRCFEEECQLPVSIINPLLFSEENLLASNPEMRLIDNFRPDSSLYDIIIIPDWNMLVEGFKLKDVNDFSLYIARIIRFLDRRNGILLIFGTKSKSGVILNNREIYRRIYDFCPMNYEDKSITVIR